MDGASDVLVQVGVVDDEAQVTILLGNEEARRAPFGRVILWRDHPTVKKFPYESFLLFLSSAGEFFRAIDMQKRRLPSRCQVNSHGNASGLHGAFR